MLGNTNYLGEAMFAFLNGRELTTQLKAKFKETAILGGHPCPEVTVLFLMTILFGLKRDSEN